MTMNVVYTPVEKRPFIGIRHLQCILLFWALTVAYAMRVNFSLAIIAMTDNKSANPDFEEYNWTEYERSLLLSSFFWGYVITQIPGGFVAKKFGGKVSMGIGLFISSVTSILTPWSARIGGWKFIFALRVLQGMSQGVIFPSTHTLLAKWSHKDERALFATIAYSGSHFGTIIMFMSSGLIISSMLGWPGIFYSCGISGFIWTICWYIWGASSPCESKSIKSVEKAYIEMSILNESQKTEEATSNKHMKTPWLKFLTSLPFWAILAAQSAFAWAFWMLVTQIPTYMKNILNFNINSNALLSSLPYIALLLLNLVFSVLDSFIRKHQWLSLTWSRKFFNTLGLWVPAVALAYLGYVDANHTILAVLLLVIAVGFNSGVYMGFMVNIIDLSPNFAGIMLGITNMVANFMGILAPLTVGFVVSDATNPLQWRIVFFISSGICFFGNLVFILCGSAKVQYWNEPESILVSTEEPKHDENTT